MGVEWRNRPHSGRPLVAGLLRRQKFRVPSVYTSRRRYDSPEIRHLRSYVRRGRPAPLGRGSAQDRTSNGNTTGSAVPRGDGGGGSAVPGRRWRRRVERRQQQRRQQQRIEWGCRRHELRLVVALVDVHSRRRRGRVFDAPRRSSDQATRSRGGESSTGSATPRGGSSSAAVATPRRAAVAHRRAGQHRRDRTIPPHRAARSRRTAARATAGR